MEPIPPSPTSPPSLPSEMPRRDTGTTMQVAVENVEEQPVHVPMSSHFETAFVTVKSIVAGGIAGMVAKSVVAPVDRIKILFQVSSEDFSLRKVFHLMRRIHNEEGLAGLWKGNSATMLRVFPYAGIQFMTFDAIKAYILRLKNEPPGGPGGQLSNMESLFAGSFAGFVSCTCTYPLDFARARLAVEGAGGGVCAAAGAAGGGGGGGGLSHNVFYIFRMAYNEGGFLSLYRGITPTLLGILPYAGIAFTINDKANHQIFSLTGHEPSTLQKLACGAFAGLAAQSATYPLDVVRRRMQTAGLVTAGASVEGALYGGGKRGGGGGGVSTVGGGGGGGTAAAIQQEGGGAAAAAAVAPSTSSSSSSSFSSSQLRPTMRQVLKQVYRQEGVKGLFKGLSMNWLKGPIALGISFTTFDFLKKNLNVQQPQKKTPIL